MKFLSVIFQVIFSYQTLAHEGQQAFFQLTEVSILDNSGKAIRTEAYNETVSFSGLSNGIYFLKFSFDNTYIIKRIVKQ